MADSGTLWFAGRTADFLLYRVNRRPFGEDTLLPTVPPDDVLDHFRRVLAPGWPVITGRKHQRSWRMGGIEADEEARVLTGKLGWVPRGGEEEVPEWDDHAQDWTSSTARPHGGKILPFAFDGDTRVLSVLRDSTTNVGTIAQVFEKTLRENERELDSPTAEWSVEPILDRRDFKEWLESTDVVESVGFTARLPNPEPREAFRDLAERMNRRRATTFTEEFKSQHEGGLSGIEEDPDFQQAEEMGAQGFATWRGVGERDGRTTRYTQRERVARESIEDLPASWEEMRTLLVGFLKERAKRLIEDDDDAN